MPGYGVPEVMDGALPWTWALEVIEACRNPVLGTVRPDGRPHLMPLWGVWMDDHGFVFSTAITSVKSKNLLANPSGAVSFERGEASLVLEGRAEVIELERLPGFVEAYKKKYDFEIKEGPVWLLRPTVAYAFNADDTFATSATRWTFE
jgi:hypothetical protein